jgi:hypothetical protein
LLKFKQLAQILPLLSILGLSGCISSDVSNLFITGVKLTPANPTIGATGTQQFALTVTFLDGQTSNVRSTRTTVRPAPSIHGIVRIASAPRAEAKDPVDPAIHRN